MSALGRYSPELVDGGFAIEIADAPLLHDGLNLADLAHLVVLDELRLIPSDAADALYAVLLESHRTGADSFGYDPVHGETYNCRERVFSARLGDAAGWLHVARTRREAVRIAMRLRVRADLLDLLDAAAAFLGSLATQAEAHAETYMADQTYLQHAQPSTFGHYLLAFAHPAQRDAERLWSELAQINRSAGGVGAVNGPRLPYDRERVAELLAFDGIVEHTRDAMWQTDALVAAVSAATDLTVSLSKLAEDLEIWASDEFGWIALADRHSRSSVMMPQKRNPYALSMVRGEAGLLVGRLTGLLAVTRTPSARSDGLIFAYGEVPRALQLAARATRLMAGVVSGLEVDSTRMRQTLERSFTQSTDLADVLMQQCAMDYRTAYRIVGEAVRAAAAEGLAARDITTERLDAAATAVIGHTVGLSASAIEAGLDPVAIVATRTVPGGAAPDRVRDMAKRCSADAGELASRVAARRSSFVTAERALLARAEARSSSPATPSTHHSIPEKD